MGFSDFRIPGIYTRVFDATQFVAPSLPLMAGMAGIATKGPFNEVVELTNISDFFKTFGPPSVNAQSYYAADAYFARGNLLRFIRVSGGTPAEALLLLTVTGGGSSPTIQAISDGTWGEDIDIYVTTGSAGGATIKLDVYYLGGLVESYDNLANDSDGAALLTAINGNSLYVEAVAGVTGGTIVDPQNGSLAGGDDGTPTSANYIGTQVGNTRTGLKMFLNRREYPLNLLLCPDANAIHGVQEYLLTLAETRGDSFALIDGPDSLDADGIVDWVDATGPYTAGNKLDSSFGATYWPWVQMRDDKNNQDVWTPTSGHVSGVIAYNDATAWPWFAPAGMARGVMTQAIQTRMPLLDSEIEDVYADSRVNTLIRRGGVTINGHKTLQDNTTALRYVEVRRALLALRALAEDAAQRVQFNPDDERTFRELTGNMGPVIDFLLENRAFRDLAFQCDAAINPSESKRLHRIRGRFYCKPTIAADVIILDLVLTAEGLSFSEQVTQTI